MTAECKQALLTQKPCKPLTECCVDLVSLARRSVQTA